MECLVRELELKPQEIFFWGTHSGAELDLLWQSKKGWQGAEFKYSDAPKMTKSMESALKDLNLSRLYVIYPGTKRYALSQKVVVLPLTEIQRGSAAPLDVIRKAASVGRALDF